MSPIADSDALDEVSAFQNLLDEPEQDGLLRMTKLAEHVFRVPVAYMALLGHDLEVVTRVGSGHEHWKYLQTYPLRTGLAKPILWPDSSGAAPAGFVSGDLRFAASAPLRSSNGLDLGVLVIADVRERPDFSQGDQETLVELARMLSGKMELRMVASRARESELSVREAERRFRNIADSAPVMIIYSGADGATSFVNRKWLEFTGRSVEEELIDGPDASFHPDYREIVMQTYWDAFQARKPVAQEFLMRRHDGVYRWMRTNGVPRFRDDGSYAGYIGCFVDVTDQRSAVSAKRKQALCMAAVAAAAGAFYLILDTEGGIEQTSPLCQRTSGRDPAGVCGSFLREVCDAAVAGGETIRAAVRRAASSRETAYGTTFGTPPGGKGLAEVHWSFTPIVSEDNEVFAVVATTLGLSGCPGCASGQG